MESSVVHADSVYNAVATRAAFSLRKFVRYVRKHWTINAWLEHCTPVQLIPPHVCHLRLCQGKRTFLFWTQGPPSILIVRNLWLGWG